MCQEKKTKSKYPKKSMLITNVSMKAPNHSEKLNLFFSKISEKLVSEHPQQNLPFDFDKLMSYVNSKVPDNIKFTIPLMKSTDLRSIIGSLDVTKATGLDELSPKI